MKSIREMYDSLSPRYEKRWGNYVRRSVRETLARVRAARGERLLDIGCGTGALLRELAAAGVRCTGVDLSVGMLSQARFAAAPLACGDAEALPFGRESFDVVVTSSSFHFFPHPELALEEIRRVLRRNGRLVITDWCDDYVACRMCDAYLRFREPQRRKILSRSECIDLLEARGFRVLRVDAYKISWLWGLMTAVAEAA